MSNKLMRRLISIGLVVLVALYFGLTTDSFFSPRNITVLLRDSAYLGMCAVGVAFVIIGGGIDLSAGGIVCLSGIVAARASYVGVPGVICILLAIATGLLCGLLNSLLITRLHLTEFVATLASGFVYSGFAMVITFRDNGTVVPRALTDKGLLMFGKIYGGLYLQTYFWIVLVIVLELFLTRTVLGLHTYAQGSNAKATMMSGVQNSKIKRMGFLICGGCCGLAAAFTVAFQTTATLSLGSGYEFMSIASCVVGGVVLGGGKGDAISAFIGAVFLTMITNGLYKVGVNTAWQYVLEGAIIIMATTFDALFAAVAARRIMKAAEKETAANIQGSAVAAVGGGREDV